MRKILFRGKDLYTDQWVFGDLITKKPSSKFTSDTTIFDGSWHPVDPDTIGQYTGDNDINGTPIYEGDIIQRDGQEDVTAEVVYEYSSFRGVGHYLINGDIGWMLHQGYKIKVIGNIHDK